MGKPSLSSEKEAEEGTASPMPHTRAGAVLSVRHDSEHRSQGKTEGTGEPAERTEARRGLGTEARPSSRCLGASTAQTAVTRKSVPGYTCPG